LTFFLHSYTVQVKELIENILLMLEEIPSSNTDEFTWRPGSQTGKLLYYLERFRGTSGWRYQSWIRNTI